MKNVLHWLKGGLLLAVLIFILMLLGFVFGKHGACYVPRGAVPPGALGGNEPTIPCSNNVFTLW